VSVVQQSWARFLSVFKKRGLDREFDDEALSHLALAIEDYVERGMPLSDAQRLARVKFGAIEASKDAHRDSRGLPWLESLFYDLRFALRGLQRDRAFTLAAIAMLALALGLNATVFTVMNTVLFRGFPLVQRNDRLVYIQERRPSGLCCISYLDFEDWRSQAHAFEDMAFVAGKTITFSHGEGRPIITSTTTVSANAFRLLGVPPMLGRDFVLADELPGAAPVAILSYRFWMSRFDKRAGIVGSTVYIDRAPATIIGVMPEGFDFPNQENLWLPLAHTPELQQRGPGGYMAFGRLRDGAKLQEARAELETINRRLETAWPATNRGVVPRMDTWSQIFIGPEAPIVYGSLGAAAWFVLLIACANLANLTLARTLGRSREFATRIALGAGQARMIRQILVESLALASMAGILAWWITKWSVRTWAVATASRFQVLDYTVGSGTLAWLVAISVGAAILFSLAPIGRALQLDVNGALKGDARGVTRGMRGKHLAAVLVAGQMALAIVLLSGAGVLVRSLLNVVSAETGVRDPEKILVEWVRLPSGKYSSPATRLGYFDRLEARLRTIPGIQNVSVASSIPVGSGNLQTFEIEGRPGRPDGGDSAQFLTAGSDYFRVMGTSAISGRDFNDGDHISALPVAIVNQSFAARFWPGEQSLGKRLRATDRNTRDANQPGKWRTVVGVVPNIMQGDPTRQHFKPLIYLPFRQEAGATAFFFLRTGVPPDKVGPAVRAGLQNLDPDVVLEDFTTLKGSFAFDRDRMDLEHGEMGKHAAVAPIFALIALLLAAIGLYAVIAHSIGQRTKEIGVRMAIGAAAGDIRGMVLRDGMLPVAIGMILGLGASFAVNRILQSQLVGVSPYDPATMAGAPLILILVSLLACRIPARRAMNVDPAVALRHD
jgi:putative ABC transport system permease protein